jgi:hypothetical protein
MKMDAAVMLRAIDNDLPTPSTMKFKAGELMMACRLVPNFEFEGEIHKLIDLIEDRKGRLLDEDSRTVNAAINHLRKFAGPTTPCVSRDRTEGIGGSLGWRND